MFLKALMQWIHVGSVVLMIGGFSFFRVVLLPIAKRSAEPAALITSALRRFSGVVWTALLTILISGLYNFITFFRAARVNTAVDLVISDYSPLHLRLRHQTLYRLSDIYVSNCPNIPISGVQCVPKETSTLAQPHDNFGTHRYLFICVFTPIGLKYH